MFKIFICCLCVVSRWESGFPPCRGSSPSKPPTTHHPPTTPAERDHFTKLHLLSLLPRHTHTGQWPSSGQQALWRKAFGLVQTQLCWWLSFVVILVHTFGIFGTFGALVHLVHLVHWYICYIGTWYSRGRSTGLPRLTRGSSGFDLDKLFPNNLKWD